MRPVSQAALAVAILATAALAHPAPEAAARPGAAPVTHAPAWKSWDQGLAEAQQSGRPVLVDVYTDWCGWCKRMDRDVYAKPEMIDYLGQHWVVVRLNAEADIPIHYRGETTTEAAVANTFGVSSYPTTVMLKPSGERIVNVPGYLPAGDFKTVLRFVAEGHLERGEHFEDFRRSAGP
jgi:thioredoxin-related protein